MLQVGSDAPAFQATSHHGQPVSLEDLQGKRAILWFYPKADTPG